MMLRAKKIGIYVCLTLATAVASGESTRPSHEKKVKKIETGTVIWNSVEAGARELSLRNEKGEIFALYVEPSVGREIELHVGKNVRVVDSSFSGKGLRVDAWMLMEDKPTSSSEDRAKEIHQRAILELEKAGKDQLKAYAATQNWRCWGTCTFLTAGIWRYDMLRVSGYSSKHAAESAIANECSWRCDRPWTTGCLLESVSCR